MTGGDQGFFAKSHNKNYKRNNNNENSFIFETWRLLAFRIRTNFSGQHPWWCLRHRWPRERNPPKWRSHGDLKRILFVWLWVISRGLHAWIIYKEFPVIKAGDAEWPSHPPKNFGSFFSCLDPRRHTSHGSHYTSQDLKVPRGIGQQIWCEMWKYLGGPTWGASGGISTFRAFFPPRNIGFE